MSIGDALADARRQAGLTITQVSQRTCIRETIIRGIEHGDFSACGGDFYARGHIRSVARAVGADDEELIREYDAAHGAPQAIRAADVFEPATPIKIKERRRPNWSLAMVLVLAVIAGYGIYRVVDSAAAHSARAQASSGQLPQQHQTHPATAASTPAATPSAPAVNPNVVVSLTAIQDCWVEFTRPDGRFLSQAYVVGGSSKTWTFSRTVRMDIGNPGGIVLTVNGKKLGSPGATGQPVTLSLGPGKPVTS
ncbi:MAG: helix-turn-helix domain-containing protein [Streptosporangiaceae bacterium]